MNWLSVKRFKPQPTTRYLVSYLNKITNCNDVNLAYYEGNNNWEFTSSCGCEELVYEQSDKVVTHFLCIAPISLDD